jgi:hypothetical protein
MAAKVDGMKSMVVALTLAMTTAPVWAQSGWEADLAVEIDLAVGCKLAYLSHIVERQVDGKQLVMAKAHCEDQRVFDAMRPDAFEAFRFNECEADTTKAC